MEYRVWCKNKNEWEKDDFALKGNGQLIQLRNMQPLRGETHIVELHTGLEDKNGVEIYEGDIVKSKMMNFVKAQVVFYSNSWCLDVPNSGREGWIENILSDTTMEVVGNIHENKELLGEI